MISIANDFSRFPAGRYTGDGPYSGESFRVQVLVPALRRGPVTIDLDGVLGFGSSFLEEAFGGLVRKEGFTKEQLRGLITLQSTEDPSVTGTIWLYISNAKAP